MKNRRTSRKPKGHESDARVKGAQRLELVRQGIAEGKSNGQIARKLGYDEKTIRRDIEKLELPEALLDAVKRGESAEQHLRVRRSTAAAREREIRLVEEKESGCHSDNVSEHILDWLMEHKELVGSEEEAILDKLDRENSESGDNAVSARLDPAKTLQHREQVELRELRKRREQEILLDEPSRRWAEHAKARMDHRATQKPGGKGEVPGDMPSRVEMYVRVLATGLPLIAPEWMIRDRAIAKAIRAVQKPGRRPRTAPPGYREYTVARRPY